MKEKLHKIKLEAIGKMYIASTHSQNDSVFISRAVEVIEELIENVKEMITHT